MKNTLKKWLGISKMESNLASIKFDLDVTVAVSEFLNNQIRILVQNDRHFQDLLVKTPTKKPSKKVNITKSKKKSK